MEVGGRIFKCDSKLYKKVKKCPGSSSLRKPEPTSTLQDPLQSIGLIKSQNPQSNIHVVFDISLSLNTLLTKPQTTLHHHYLTNPLPKPTLPGLHLSFSTNGHHVHPLQPNLIHLPIPKQTPGFTVRPVRLRVGPPQESPFEGRSPVCSD